MFNTSFDAANKLWSGSKKPIEIDRNKNFGETLLENLSIDSEHVMQIDGDTGETLTKAEIRKRTIRCAQNLTKLGCTQNDIIGIVARNHHNLTPLLYASFCIGVPVSPLDVAIVDDGLSDVIQRVRPSFVFCDADVLKSVKAVIDGAELNAQLFTVDEPVDGFDAIDDLMSETGNEDSFVCAKVDVYSQISIISCSSGTTGRAKSVMLPQATLSAMVPQNKDGNDSVGLFFSSLYWFSGIITTVWAAFENIRLFTKHSFNPELFLDLVQKYKVERFFLTPRQLHLVLSSEQINKFDLSSLKLCILAGSRLPATLVQAIQEYIPRCVQMNGYGLTETGGVSFTMELQQYPSTVGMLLPNVEAKIISETGERFGPGDEGEICLKVPIHFLGYYKNEEATRRSFDDEGFFITGDLGHFDETGRLYVTGRKSEFFKSRDFAISSAEIETILMEHQAICVACVVSVYDEKMITDLPAAVIVKKEQHSITEDEVYSLIADRLPIYKHLDGGIHFVDDLPMTPSGKVSLAKVTEIARNAYKQRKVSV